jgi:hypothetical protein
MAASKPPQENPLANILINVLIPVLALSFLSKDPAIQEKIGKTAQFWHIGPLKAMIVALTLPLAYGIRFLIIHKKLNFFSNLGVISVLLTGGLTLYLWNKDGSVKDHAGLLFGIKEGSIPLVLGFAILRSARSASPLLNVFLYNDSVFDVPKIEQKVRELSAEQAYRTVLDQANRLFAISFFLSAAMNVALAQWFFRNFDPKGITALETYNGIVGKLTGWGFAVIGVPILIFLFFTLRSLLKGLGRITGFKDEELMMPR